MTWLIFAFLSAFFAAITAILAKIGIKNVNSNLATAVRTVVILIFAWGIVFAQGTIKELGTISVFLTISRSFRNCHRTFLVVLFSRIATGSSFSRSANRQIEFSTNHYLGHNNFERKVYFFNRTWRSFNVNRRNYYCLGKMKTVLVKTVFIVLFVSEGRLELPRLIQAQVPKTCVYANFTTLTLCIYSE